MSGYARVTRYSGASPEQISSVVERIDATNEPPPGVPSSGVKLLVNEDEGIVMFVGFFDTEEDMRTGDAALREMDVPGGTPGTLDSIGLFEIKVEKSTD